MFFSRHLNRRAAARALHLTAGCAAAAMGATAAFWYGAPAKADTVPTYLHTLASATEGSLPTSALVLGASGAYYGTATTGGANSEGTIFDVTTSGALTVLHTFSASATDGEYPTGGLTLGSDGNFYGTTTYGGSTLATTNTTANPTGEGTIYSMTASGTLTLLHSFGDGTVANDGAYPTGKLVQGSDGTIYGTTLGGGAYGLGTVYSVTTAGVVTIVYSFGASDIDGVFPDSGVVIGTDGNLYGTTSGGGTSYSDGTVFQLTTAGVETVLHDFNDGSVTDDGITPTAALVQGVDGNFYGTTFHGGSTATGQGVNGDGTVYKITSTGTLTILHSFRDGSVSNDGMEPIASLTQDSTTGTLYGDTTEGGSTVSTSILYGYGTLFSISTTGTYALLHSFGTSSTTDPGEFPAAALALNSTDGYLYGSTAFDPTDSAGTIFKIAKTATGTTSTTTRFDFNGDGHADLLWYNSTSGALSAWDMDDTSVLSYGNAFATIAPSSNWVPVAAPDANGDGDPDILWWNKFTGAMSIWTLSGTTVTNYGAAFATVSDTNWKPVAVADNSGSAWTLVFQNSSTGAVSRWTINDTTVTSYGGALATLGAGTPWQIVGAPDLDNDGYSDLLFWNSSTGEVSYWGTDLTNQKVISYNADIAQVPDTTWHLVGSEDTNGDGHSDLLWWNTTSGVYSRWLLDGTTVTSYGGATATVSDTTWQPTAIR